MQCLAFLNRLTEIQRFENPIPPGNFAPKHRRLSKFIFFSKDKTQQIYTAQYMVPELSQRNLVIPRANGKSHGSSAATPTTFCMHCTRDQLT